MENNVAVEVIEKIKEDLKKNLTEKPIKRGEVANVIKSSLKETLNGLFKERFDLIAKTKEKKPYVICFFGIINFPFSSGVKSVPRYNKRGSPFSSSIFV